MKRKRFPLDAGPHLVHLTEERQQLRLPVLAQPAAVLRSTRQRNLSNWLGPAGNNASVCGLVGATLLRAATLSGVENIATTWGSLCFELHSRFFGPQYDQADCRPAPMAETVSRPSDLQLTKPVYECNLGFSFSTFGTCHVVRTSGLESLNRLIY